MKTNWHRFPKTFCVLNWFKSLKRKIVGVYFSRFLLKKSTIELFHYMLKIFENAEMKDFIYKKCKQTKWLLFK